MAAERRILKSELRPDAKKPATIVSVICCQEDHGAMTPAYEIPWGTNGDVVMTVTRAGTPCRVLWFFCGALLWSYEVDWLGSEKVARGTPITIKLSNWGPRKFTPARKRLT